MHGLVDGPIDPAPLLAAVAHPTCGAVVLFLGAVRNRHEGRAVTGIRYDAHRTMAEARLALLLAEVGAEHGARLAVVHRVGELAAGEVSVAIAAAAPGREAAYTASRRALERLKRELPVWKLERYADGSAAWREEERLRPVCGAP